MRGVRINADATFLDLRDVVARACEYGDSQLTCFYVVPEGKRLRVQIALTEMPLGETDDDSYVMERTALRDFLTYKGQKFTYVFDTFNDRKLTLEVMEIEPKAALKRPRIVKSEGTAPEELPIVSDGAAAGSSAVGGDLYGGSEFDDYEGLDEGDIDPDSYTIKDL